MKHTLLLPLLFALASCATTPPAGGPPESQPPMSSYGMPQVVNVSAYDPKEKQRPGQGYSEHDVSALRANGASALIARAGKGGNLDEKCAHFLASADRAGMLPGVYYRLQTHVDAVKQADQFCARAHSLARGRAWNAPALLLCADFDAHSGLSDILRFMERVESRTGVVPVAYLENSTHLKQLLSSADPATKAKLRRMPYWLALYAHDSGAGPVYPAPGTPRGLLHQYQVWSDWAMWQYGGVDWARGRSQPKVYNHGMNRNSLYFGSLDRPVERNVFNGSHAAMQSFWQQHGLPLH
ncbi:GH25 family lysozyme [Prosthecobacter sp.]|uniref:GH25 family lysozyme n=1 Tax=Prosthecobacter sp. TaxID=1965333 RepID=UPI003783C954